VKSSKIADSLSNQRLNSYLSKPEGYQLSDEERFIALELYKKNILAYQKVYPGLHTLEVVYRNAVHREVAKIVGINNWVQDFVALNGSRQHQDLKQWCSNRYIYIGNQTWKYFTEHEVKEKDLHKVSDQVIEAIDKIIKMCANNSIYNSSFNNMSPERFEGYLISKLTFGFWSSFLTKAFNDTLKNKGLRESVFPNSDIGNQITKRMNEIRNFRNAVFHHVRIDKDIDSMDRMIWETVGFVCKDCQSFFHPYKP
jgi:hypothetical protein